MSRGRKIIPKVRKAAKKPAADASSPPRVTEGPIDFAVRYAEACGFAIQSKNDEARQIYLELDVALACAEGEVRLRAPVCNDLAALAAMEGRFDEALAGWRAAVGIDPDCLPARLNRDLIEAELSFSRRPVMSASSSWRRHRCHPHLWVAGAALFSPDLRVAGAVGSGAPSPALRAPSPRTGRGGRRVASAELDWPTAPGPPFARRGKGGACGDFELFV